MKCYKQLLMGAACAAFILSGVNVNAAEEGAAADDEFVSKITSGENVVLFKIHDVASLKNDDGVITECEFSLTLYNRSPKYIDGATIDLTWVDEGVSSVIEEEEKKDIEDVAAGRDKVRRMKLPKTENFVSKDLTASVNLPSIKPFRQVSLKSKIKSDRCFLMIEDATYTFSSCNVSDTGSSNTNKNPSAGNAIRLNSSILAQSGSSVGGGSECDNLFRFVSARDPEYYREFQKVSFNEEASQRQESRAKDLKEFEDNYGKIMENLNDAVTTLEGIN